MNQQESKDTSSRARYWLGGVGVIVLVGGVGIWQLRAESPVGAVASLPSAPASTSTANLNSPPFVRFEVPTSKVQIRVVGEGFEVINNDPGLTGQNLEFSGVHADGSKVPFNVVIPPPLPQPGEAPLSGSE